MGFRRFLSAAIIAVCVVVPLVEAFDTWDQTLRDDNDTEATVVIAAVCVGFALTVAATAAILDDPRLRTVAPRAHLKPWSPASLTTRHLIPSVANDSSPPLALRI